MKADEPPTHRIRFKVCCSYYRGIGHNIKDCPVDLVNVHKKTKHILVNLKLLTV